MTRSQSHVRWFVAATLACVLPGPVAAQNPPAAETPPPAVSLSGVAYANYQYRTDNPHTPAAGTNKFDLERVYLTFRAPAGDRTSVRVTTDVFQQTNAANAGFYGGWVVRIKYAYLQYDYLKTADWNANVRLGVLHTVEIDHEETFWPRWISQVALERAGYFSSADAGIATTVTLPNKWGEVYGTITNGPGYTNRETDRFKDFAARLSVTPLATGTSLFKTFTVSPWIYKGNTASRFASGGAGQLGPIGEGLDRNRWGIFAGVKDPKLVLGGQYAEHTETFEGGANTALSPRVASDSTGSLWSAYAVVKPILLVTDAKSSPFGLVARWDQVKLNKETSPDYHFFIGGLIWDISSRAQLSLDYQEQIPSNGAPVAITKTYFGHVVVNF
jgi:hypothetical protein